MHFPGPSNGSAEFFEARARNYSRQAALLLQRDSDRDSAAALLYEAAKQYVNAVANRLGDNPATVGAKLRSLREVAEFNIAPQDLVENWQAAVRLHIHADRGHLTQIQFDESWEKAQLFTRQMLQVYSASTLE